MSSNWKHYLHFIVCKLCLILEYKCPEIQLRVRDAHRLKGRRWKKVFHAKRNDKKIGVAIYIFDKIDFKTEAKKRNKEGHYTDVKAGAEGATSIWGRIVIVTEAKERWQTVC